MESSVRTLCVQLDESANSGSCNWVCMQSAGRAHAKSDYRYSINVECFTLRGKVIKIHVESYTLAPLLCDVQNLEGALHAANLRKLVLRSLLQHRGPVC